MSKLTKQKKSRERPLKDQKEGEVIILVEHKHPVVMRKQLVYGMLIILVALLPWAFATANTYSWINYANWFLLGGILILTFYWFRTWVGWYYSVYVISSTRVMVVNQEGFFGREVNEISLDNIQSVNYKIKGAQASILGYGDVIVETLSGGKPIRLKKARKPAKLQQAIIEVVHRTS